MTIAAAQRPPMLALSRSRKGEFTEREQHRWAIEVRTTHADHHYSITVHCDDLAVVGCLRAVAQHCQTTGNARIAWGHTKEPDWKRDGKKVTFHFSQRGYRAEFKQVAFRVLRDGLFTVATERDDDPATPAEE